MIRPEDDSFHPRTDDPTWNESTWFSFAVPERDLGGMVYSWFRPNKNMLCSGPLIWDRTGDLPFDCLWYDFNWLQDIPEGADVLNYRSPHGLSIEQLKPLYRYRFVYERPGCELDLVWEAADEPREMTLLEAIAVAGVGHYDQIGRVTGTVTLDGEQIDVDCWSLRDRSWGPRSWATLPRTDYLYGIASESSYFVVATAEDGEDDKVLGGHLVRDGVYGHLVSGRRRTVERIGPRPALVEVEAEDNLGRPLSVRGRTRSWLAAMSYPDISYWQGLMSWDYEGGDTIGEIAETLPFQRMRASIRASSTGLGNLTSQLEALR